MPYNTPCEPLIYYSSFTLPINLYLITPPHLVMIVEDAVALGSVCATVPQARGQDVMGSILHRFTRRVHKGQLVALYTIIL